MPRNRPRSAVGLALCALVSCGGRGGPLKPEPLAPGPRLALALPPSARVIGTCDKSVREQTVTFAHVNDLHAHYVPEGPGQNPYARLRALADGIRRENPFTVFTDGGDAFEKGSIADSISRGEATREVNEAMGFDVRVLGNHDFAWGANETRRLTQGRSTVTVATNVRDATKAWGAVPYVEFDVGCVRVGFFGLLPRPFGDDDNDLPTGNYYPDMPGRTDTSAVAREIIAQHRGGVQLLVAVSHLGVDADETLAREAPGIDVVLGAHTHTALHRPRVIKDRTLVIQAGWAAEHLARLDVRYDLARKRIADYHYDLIENKTSLPADPGVVAAVDRVLARDAPDHDKRLGAFASSPSTKELATIVARAGLARLHVDGAFYDKSMIRVGAPSGAVTRQQLFALISPEREPPGTEGFNGFYVVTVSGATLAGLRHSLPESWEYAGREPDEHAPAYRIALPKKLAFHPDQAGLKSVSFAGQAPGCEAWEALDYFARTRQDACTYLDKDAPLPGCAR